MSTFVKTVDIPLNVFFDNSEEIIEPDDTDNSFTVIPYDLFHENVSPWQPNVSVMRSPVGAKYSLDVYEISMESDIQYTQSLIMRWNEKALLLRGRFPKERDVYESAMNISDIFVHTLQTFSKNQKYTFWGAFDSRHRLRSVMLISGRSDCSCYDKCLEISLLLSKPKAPDKHVRGAGAVLVDHAERESVRRGFNGIVLMPVASAVGFYSHLGLKFMEDQLYMFKKNQFENSIV